MHTPVARQVDLECALQRAAVIALEVRGIVVSIPVPSGMIGIELLGASRERQTAIRSPA